MNFPIIILNTVLILCGTFSSVAGTWTLKIGEENVIIRESISKSKAEAEGGIVNQVVVCNGKTVTIECELDPSSNQTNYPNLTTVMRQWKFGDMKSKMLEQNKQNTKIKHIFDTNREFGVATYISCNATYSISSGTSYSYSIQLYSNTIKLINFNCQTVQQSPRIYKKRTYQRVKILCSTNDFRDYENQENILWFLDGKVLPGRWNDVLTLTNLSMADNGLYQCLAYAGGGSPNTSLSVTESYLRVIQQPEPFENFTATQINASMAMISWAPRIVKRPNRMGVLHYVEPRPEKYTIICICYCGGGGSSQQIFNKSVEVMENENENDSRIYLTNLRPLQVYTCVATWLNAFEVQSSKEITFKIFQTAVNNIDNNNNNSQQDDEGSNLIRAKIGQSIILDCFKHLQDRRFSKIEWSMRYSDEPESEITIASNDRRLEQQGGNLTLDPYMPSDAGNYTCSIRRFQPPLSYSETFRIETFTGVLQLVIRNLRCGNYTKSSFEIEWEKLETVINGEVEKYKIVYWNRHSIRFYNRLNVKEAPGNANSVAIDNLSPETIFRIIVISILKGDHQYSAPARISCMTGSDD